MTQSRTRRCLSLNHMNHDARLRRGRPPLDLRHKSRNVCCTITSHLQEHNPYCELVQILLVWNTLVRSDEDVKVIGGKTQKLPVLSTGPAILLNGLRFDFRCW